jgi:hypothetical protein
MVSAGEPRISYLPPGVESDGRPAPFRRASGLLIRIGLAAVFVFVCHQFQWELVVRLTSESILRLSQLLGIAMTRVAFDTLQWNGQVFPFELDCCQLDVFCAAIPLIWNLKASVWQNLIKVIGFFVGLFVFNVLRLEIGLVLYCSHGVPWIFAHNYVGGLNLFIIFLWVVRQYKLASGMNGHPKPA